MTIARGGREKIVWLTERPPEHGGLRALGCVMRAALLHRLVEECGPQKGRQANQKLSTRFARFEVRSPASMNSLTLEQHSRTECHIKVVDAFLRPAKRLLEILTPSPGTDDQLLSGEAPQVAMLRSSTTLVSYRGASANMRIEHYIDPDSPEVHYRLVQELFAIRSEVCRRLERFWLSKAESIPRSLNDRNEFKTVGFKCDCRAECR